MSLIKTLGFGSKNLKDRIGFEIGTLWHILAYSQYGIGALWHILLHCQYGIWTHTPFEKGPLVPKEAVYIAREKVFANYLMAPCTCKKIYIFLDLHTYIHKYSYMCVCINQPLCISLYVYTHVCFLIFVCVYVYIYIYT